MKLDKELAKYILHLQAFKESELGLDSKDKEITIQIKDSFPEIMKEENDKRFDNYLWSFEVEKDKRVKDIRKQYQILRLNHPSFNAPDYEEYLNKMDELITTLDSTKKEVYNQLDKEILRKVWEDMNDILI